MKADKVVLKRNYYLDFFLLLAFAASAFFCYFVYQKKLWLFTMLTGFLLLFLVFASLYKFIFNKPVLAKIFLLAFWFVFVLSAIFALLKILGFSAYLQSAIKFKQLILKTGAWGVFVFIAIQIIQVVLSPVPGVITIVVGAQIYGPFLGFLYSSVGIILGSILAFFLGRLLGRNIMYWLVGKEDAIKYRKLLSKKGKFLLPLAFLFPFFPDDIICIVAGSTVMSFWFFLIITMITRPVSILISSYLLSGKVIPFMGWGIVVWVGILLFMISLFMFIYKNESKITRFFLKKRK